MTRRLSLLGALAVVALMGAGCSKGPPGTGVGAGAASAADNRAQGVKFAQCMRDHGVAAFPDPGASGQLTIDGIANGSAVDTNTAAFKQAISACQDLEPPGFTGDQRSAQEQKKALEFAQCMRDNGVPDFPDPTPDGPLIDTNRIPSLQGKDPRPVLAGPSHKCRDFAAAAGVTGGP